MAPDLLLLDEPTNHLDFTAIEWLEETLLSFPGSVLLVTHDRRFLDSVALRIVVLDRGHLSAYPGNYRAYQQKKAEELETEAVHRRKFDKVLAQEEVWIRKGIEARRTARSRRQGRPRARRRRALGPPGRGARASRQELRRETGGEEFLLPYPARRQGRADRAERQRQDDTASPDPRGNPAGFRQGAPRHEARHRLFRPVPRGSRRRSYARRNHQPGKRPRRSERSEKARDRLSRGFSLPARARPGAREIALRRRAQPPAARAPLQSARQRAGVGRADQRSGHRNAGAAGIAAAGIRGHALPGEPRPRISRQRRDPDDRERRRGQMEGICRRLQRLAARAVETRSSGKGEAEDRRARTASSHTKQQARLQGGARARRIAGQAKGAGTGARANRRLARGSRAVS